MKRLSILFVGLLSAVLVFSVVGLATQEGTVDADLKFNSVINISTNPSFNETLITQDGTPTDSDFDLSSLTDENIILDGSFTLDIHAVTDFKVLVGYAWSNSGTTSESSASLGTPSEVLFITNASDNSALKGDLSSSYLSKVAMSDMATSGDTLDITSEAGFSGSNNSPGTTSSSLGLGVSLGNLGDRGSGETITFTTNIYVSDSTT